MTEQQIIERTIMCPDCQGAGADGCMCWSSDMTLKEAMEEARKHRCKTCDGHRRLEIIIVRPVRSWLPVDETEIVAGARLRHDAMIGELGSLGREAKI